MIANHIILDCAETDDAHKFTLTLVNDDIIIEIPDQALNTFSNRKIHKILDILSRDLQRKT